MNFKPDEATLVSFLYGELDPLTQNKVEEYLQNNPEEKKRLEEWSFTRTAMARLHDKEVIAPPIILGESKVRPFWKENYVRMSLGVAASLLLFLVAARLLGLSANYSQGELRIGFGFSRQPTRTTLALNERQVGELIHSSLKENNTVLQASWNEDRKSLEQSIRDSNSGKIDELKRTVSTASQEQVRQFVGQMQNDNLKLMKDYMQLSTTGQKEYVESLLVEFSKYLQEQRKQDLQFFQARMNNIEQNTDQFKQETEQILTSLVPNSIGTSKSNQRRN